MPEKMIFSVNPRTWLVPLMALEVSLPYQLQGPLEHQSEACSRSIVFLDNSNYTEVMV